MASSKDLKAARKAVEKQLKVLSGAFDKMTNETAPTTESPKFRKQLDTVKEAVALIQEPIETLEGLLDEPDEE